MFLKQAFLFWAGSSAGGVIAAGIFAFLAIIGVFPRLMSVTGTGKHVFLYETMIVTGGILGNVLDLYPAPFWGGGTLVLGAFGLSTGVFVGCLVMSLAETLKALPVLSRRIRLAVGIQYLIFFIAAGKTVGAWIYFTQRFKGA